MNRGRQTNTSAVAQDRGGCGATTTLYALVGKVCDLASLHSVSANAPCVTVARRQVNVVVVTGRGTTLRSSATLTTQTVPPGVTLRVSVRTTSTPCSRTTSPAALQSCNAEDRHRAATAGIGTADAPPTTTRPQVADCDDPAGSGPGLSVVGDAAALELVGPAGTDAAPQATSSGSTPASNPTPGHRRSRCTITVNAAEMFATPVRRRPSSFGSFSRRTSCWACSSSRVRASRRLGYLASRRA